MQSGTRKAAFFGVVVAVSGFSVTIPASAGPVADAAAKAEAMAKAGDVVGAYNTLHLALSDFSASLPLSVAKAIFVTASPAGYGRYEAKPASTFQPGEILISYVEPIGLSWKQTPGTGKYQAHFTVDMDILSASGEVLVSQKAFGDFVFSGQFRNQEIYAPLKTDVSGAAAGDYILRYHFNDLNNGKKASVDQKFTIAGPASP